MIKVHHSTAKKQTLHKKLFKYMFMLTVILLLLLVAGYFLIIGFTGTKNRICKILDFQADVFERQLVVHYDSLAVLGVQLSEQTTEKIETYLSENHISFDDLNGSEKHISDLQDSIIEPLNHKMLEADCTGAFILLDAQVNKNIKNSEFSRSGLYLQRNSYAPNDSRILIYRGLPEIGKKHNAMPHRKWRLEFSTNEFPNYKELVSNASLPLNKACRITDIFTLSGTSDNVMLMAVPLIGSDGKFYGLCGFEISEYYFKYAFSQPSQLTHSVFCISKGTGGITDGSKALSSGSLNGYYSAPNGKFISKDLGNGLYAFKSDQNSYVGIIKEIHLFSSGKIFSLNVLMPKEDYNKLLLIDIVKIILLLVLFFSVATGCCWYFTYRYLVPIKRSMEKIKQKEYADAADYSIAEIDDMFAFLSEQNRINEETLAKSEKEKADAKTSLSRIADKAKLDLDPDSYAMFIERLETLTPKEHEVFNFYVEGKTTAEITEIMGISTNGLKYHNKNIYSKLGVPSKKELLRYAAILKEQKEKSSKN